MAPTAPTPADPLARVRRLLFWLGLIVALQLANTLFLWQHYGSFPFWSGLATVGLAIFTASAVARYRRTRAALQARSGPPEKKKRRRLRDPHRK